MRRQRIIFVMLLVLLLLTGCSMTTVDQMYCLPKRSEDYANLQSVIEEAMDGFEYSAPLNGEHQQTVQMADLDGDGSTEYLLYAKATSSERPLRIFIFTADNENYRLMDTIECNGNAFDQVNYIRMDERGGAELVVGRQVSDQVLRSASVYTMVEGQMEQVVATNYARILPCDLNRDNCGDLFVIRPDEDDQQKAIAEVFTLSKGTMQRSQKVAVSGSVDKIKRVIQNKLTDGLTAVYVASDVDGNAIITDVYTLIRGQLTNISMSSESGTSVETMRNYYVYADDVDNDGVLELPKLVEMKNIEPADTAETQYIIRWYALNSLGETVDKMYTYHNFVGGWYIRLNGSIAERISVMQKGNSYEFYLWDTEGISYEKLMTVYVLTGQKREEQAVLDNRFIVHRGESTIYAVSLEVTSSAYGMTQERVTSGFRTIIQDWNSGLT